MHVFRGAELHIYTVHLCTNRNQHRHKDERDNVVLID